MDFDRIIWSSEVWTIDEAREAHELLQEHWSDMPKVATHRAALELVMRNLIANSIAHRDGSQGQVVLSATQDGDWVEVTVRDDGPGISEKIADQLQMAGDAVEANGDSSLGLGLTVVQRLVDRYGGRIRVDSDASGAVIHFTWPRSTENSTPPDNR